MQHYPMTGEQRQTLERNMAAIMEILGDITGLLRACYDEQDTPVWRACEARAAMQRLVWATQRQAPEETQVTYAGESEDPPGALP
jgi:predicted secreted protein